MSLRLLPLLALAVGCAPPGPGDDLAVVSRTVLAEGDLPGVEGAPALAGVAVDPDTGAVVVLDGWGGLFVLGETIAPLASPEALVPVDGVDQRPYTDLVAMGGDRFAVTVPSDGLLHDASSGVTTVHFCYEPGWMPEQQTQVTDAVAYDAARDTLYAQPQTFSGGDLVSADLFTYDGAGGGQPVSGVALDADTRAGGMAIDGDAVLLGHGTEILRAVPERVEGGKLPAYVDLGEVLGEREIRGLALDVGDHLYVATLHEVVELSGWRP